MQGELPAELGGLGCLGTMPGPTRRLMTPPGPPDIRRLLEDEESRSGHRHAGKIAAATFIAPIAVSIGLLIVAGVLRGPETAWSLVVSSVLVFTVLGKFAILAGVSGDSPFSVWEWAGLVAYLDVTVATLLVLNLPRLYRLPRVGTTIEDLAEHGLYMLEKRSWLGRVTFFGVIVFVMFPLTGTGAIGGSIFGRLLGLSPIRTLIAIATGAAIGCSTMAAFAETFSAIFTEELRRSWEFQAAGLGVLGVVLFVVWQRGRKLTLELRARRASRNGADVREDPPTT